jgi:hypothetical protein
MLRTGAGTPGVFQSGLLTLTYFNRRTLNAQTNFSADRATSSTSFVELGAEIENNFLTWGDEAVFLASDGSVIPGTSGVIAWSAIAVDSTTVSLGGFETGDVCPNTSLGQGFTISGAASLAEGFHFATLLGAVHTNTGTWKSTTSIGATGFTKTALHVAVRG